MQEFSDALYAVKRDPNDPEFRYSIEDSLDVLDGLGRFLFQKAPRGMHNDPDDEELNNYNLICNIIDKEGTPAQRELFEKSVEMLNETLKLGFDTEKLEENEIDNNAYAERERERQERIRQRPLDREREKQERRQREAAERKERLEREQKRKEQELLQAERRFKLVQQMQKDQEEQRRRDEEKKIEAQRYREELKRREAEQARKEGDDEDAVYQSGTVF